LKDRQQEAAVSTKFGVVGDGRGAIFGLNGRPEYVRSSIEASLKRLGMEYKPPEDLVIKLLGVCLYTGADKSPHPYLISSA
jgi:hypothetical protein